MARFSGAGDFTLGSGGKLFDIDFNGTGDVTFNGEARGISTASAVGFTLTGGMIAESDLAGSLVVSGSECQVVATKCGELTVSGSRCLVSADIEFADADGATISGNLNRADLQVRSCGQHGLVVSGDDNDLSATVEQCGGDTANTYDNVHVTGNRNYLRGSLLRPRVSAPLTRYGANVVSGDCNRVVGNDLGDPVDYGTDALNDAGTNTQLTYPNDPVYGDNFTDCITSS